VGLPPDLIENFDVYLSEHLLSPCLPSAAEGLEIGPGGGRRPEFLVPGQKSCISVIPLCLLLAASNGYWLAG
jgi:hypothetical protein